MKYFRKFTVEFTYIPDGMLLRRNLWELSFHMSLDVHLKKNSQGITVLGDFLTFQLMSLTQTQEKDKGFLSTPVSDTGSQCQPPLGGGAGDDDIKLEAAIDYFQGTAVFASLEKLHQAAEFAVQFNSDEVIIWQPGKPLFCGIMWEHSASTFDGCRMGYTQLEDGRWKLWLSLPGAYFHTRSTSDAARMLTGLRYTYGFKPTRLDIKVRDYSRRKTPYDIYQEFRNGNIARVKKHKWVSSGTSEETSDTLYLGSPKSEKFLRIYDAMFKHGISAIDWELQCRDEKAEIVYQNITDIYNADIEDKPSILCKYIGATICGSIDIVYKCEGVRLSRLPRQEWWQQFCDECGGQIRISVPKKSPSLQRTLDWLDKQVCVIMSALRKGFGKRHFEVWLQSQLDKAENRFQPTHEGLIYMCKYHKPTDMQT